MNLISKTITGAFLLASLSVAAQQRSAAAPKNSMTTTLNNLKDASLAAAADGLKAAQMALDNMDINLATINGKGFIDGNNWDNNSFEKRNFKDLKTKEVSMEMAAPKGGDVYIESSSRSIEVKTWEQPKVKVSTTIYYEGDATKLTDAEWFEKLNLNVKTLGNSVIVKSGGVGGGNYNYGGGTYSWSSGGASNGVAVFDANGKNVGTAGNLKRIVTIYVPNTNKLDIDTKYADVSIANSANKVSLNITNGNAELADVANLILRSKYSNVTCGDVKMAEVEFINGRFTAKNCTEVDIDTKYSTVELGSVKKASIRSTNDEYEIDEVGSIQGRKNYGNLRITNLTGSFEMDGTNADVKVRNVAPTVNTIKVDNKYADIRLPMREVKNYALNFNGPWSTVYGNFERQAYIEPKEDTKKTEEKDGLTEQLRSIQRSVERYAGNDDSKSKFSATVGTGKGTIIDIKCQNCTVDFK
jgi:hypothetical protein